MELSQRPSFVEKERMMEDIEYTIHPHNCDKKDPFTRKIMLQARVTSMWAMSSEEQNVQEYTIIRNKCSTIVL